MRTSFLLAFAALILSVAAFGPVGTYERLWFWYAYTLDAERKHIAPNCGKNMGIGAGRRCSFVQFMNYIDQHDPNHPVDPSKIQNVDPTDIDKTTGQLSAGNYDGKYDCTHVYEGVNGQNNVAALFQKVDFFCRAKFASVPADMKTLIQEVTVGVARGRQENAIKAYQKQLWKLEPPITLHLRTVPVYDGSTATVQDLDSRTTVEHNADLDRSGLRAAIEKVRAGDGEGHANNARAAKEAAQALSQTCK